MKIMTRRERLIWITALSIIIIIWVLTETNLIRPGKANDNVYKNIRLFNEVLSYVEGSYVEPPDVEKLIYGAIDGMLASLDDPYTRFMRKEGYKDLKIETEGEFGGVGFVVTKKNGWITVVAPIDDTPASRAGLKPNDRIVKIDEESTKNMDLNEAVSRMRGKPGTYVVLWILRDDKEEPVKYKIKREKIEIESVLAKEFNYKNKKYGYIKIKQFGQDTYDHLKKILKKYDKEQLDGLILDLRNNPGGLLYSAYKIADLFLDEGMVVYTKGRLEDQNKEYFASSIDYCHDVPMCILANQGSASGSEIVVGALKDNKRAIMVGNKTFGKGVVQTVRELDEGMAVAITTAKYFTPSGVCIHKKGIEPNIEVKFPKTSEQDLKNAEKIIKGNYLDTFVKENKDYLAFDKEKQKESIEELMKKLNSDDINADYKLVRQLIKAKFREIRGMNEAILDLEDDVQLKKAVELLNVADKI